METEKIGPQGRFPPGSPVPKTRARASPKCRIGFEDSPLKAAQGPSRARDSKELFNRSHGTVTGNPPGRSPVFVWAFLVLPGGAVVIGLGKKIPLGTPRGGRRPFSCLSQTNYVEFYIPI